MPAVNDADGNGVADDVDASKATAENKVVEAEQADATAKAKLNEANADGLINPTEKAELDRLSSEATSKKAKAQELVNNLPNAVKGNLPDRLNGLTGIQVPAVNDADGNGVADDVDASKATAENKVVEAEQADATAKAKLSEFNGDGLINPTEKAELDRLSSEATSKKAKAQELVNNLPDAVKGNLPDRLNGLTGIQVPAVNDADGNGVADDVDASKATAENKVVEAEQADATAKAKLNEANADGLINPTEKAELDRLSSEATSKKAKAQELVNNLPDAVKGNLPDRLNGLTGIQVPAVNDENANGIADDVDALKETAETKVTEAEQADAAAKAKLNEFNGDGLINPTEKAELDRLSSEASSKKAEAENLVNSLPDAAKGNLPDRLNGLTGIQVPAVNDENANGIADDVDALKETAETKVTEAEQADATVKDKLKEFQKDGIITPSEQATLKQLLAIAESKKAEAQKLVNSLPESVKGNLPNRLAKLDGIIIPSANINNGGTNSNTGIAHNSNTMSNGTKFNNSGILNSTHINTGNNDAVNSGNADKQGGNIHEKSAQQNGDIKKVEALPNTGESTSQNTTLFGVLLASIGSLMLWRTRKKDNNNELNK
ncbi:hypothetical protein BU096_10610 [Staphylococcus xylosus]|nr:hypothetical protein BU096_10610 [Staphylococcus xylosus]